MGPAAGSGKDHLVIRTIAPDPAKTPSDPGPRSRMARRMGSEKIAAEETCVEAGEWKGDGDSG